MAKDELPRPPPRVSKEPYITYWDLNRSADLMIYGYRHRITDCDPFTHDFLTAQGVQVNPQEPEPSDMYGDYRSKVRFYLPQYLRNQARNLSYRSRQSLPEGLIKGQKPHEDLIRAKEKFYDFLAVGLTSTETTKKFGTLWFDSTWKTVQ